MKSSEPKKKKPKAPKRDLEAELDDLRGDFEWLKRQFQEMRTAKRGRE